MCTKDDFISYKTGGLAATDTILLKTDKKAAQHLTYHILMQGLQTHTISQKSKP